MDFIIKASIDREPNTVINMYKDGANSIAGDLTAAAEKGKTVARRIMPQSIMKDGWCRNPEGGLLFWIPHDYRMDAVDMSKTCIPATYRQELDFDLERLSLYKGSNWEKIYDGSIH